MASSIANPRPTIAVVAVHGVADQSPNSSAQAIGDLLLQSQGRRYTPAHEITLHIPTAPAIPSAGPSDPPPRRETFFEDHGYRPEPDLLTPGTHAPWAAPDHQLMLRQLRHYRGSGTPYRTVRLETQRLDQAGQPAGDIHIYEMYWADLSRLGTGFLRFFSELYQLLFHTANLGRQAIQHAALEHGHSALWKALSWVHKWAVRFLTILIPLVALVILAIGAAPIVFLLPPTSQGPVAITLVASIPALGLGFFSYRSGRSSWFVLWTLAGLALVLGTAYFLRGALTGNEGRLTIMLTGECLVLTGLVLFLLLRAYDRHRPGALVVGLALYVMALVLLPVMYFRPDPGGPGSTGLGPVAAQTTRAVLWSVEVLYSLGVLAWIVIFFSGAASWVIGAVAVRQARKPRNGISSAEAEAIADRAARAVRTSRLTLALPGAAFIVFTTLLWLVIVGATRAMLERSTPRLLDLTHCPLATGSCITVDGFLGSLIEGITGLGLPLAGFLLALFLVLLVWWLVPVVATEVRLPRGADQFSLSDRMGKWLSGGFLFVLGWISRLVAVAVLVGFGIFLFSLFIGGMDTLPAWLASILAPLVPTARQSVEVIGSFLLAGAVGVLALRRGRLEALSRAVRPVLDVVLDVDGYLREHPPERTPRARIMERYVSLLRYLCAWRNPLAPDRPYEAIVIVAHSQGTVITADLLGYLQRQHDPTLSPITGNGPNPSGPPVSIPIRLFTMGSPLRQLYEQFFPHLYSWVKRRPAAWGHVDILAPATAGGVASTGEFAANPDPAGMNISRWTNAYRAGDYVGRYLWLADGDENFRLAPRESPPARREICIGAGAHTRYWESAEIARELDRLITM